MSLLTLWQTARESIEDKHVQQIITFAGNGKLADSSSASQEFRNFLSHIPSTLLERYTVECLEAAFELRGFVLQDIVNQIGRRLAFDVSDGFYRGRQGAIGYDGIWHSKARGDIVLEVKTTDAYQIDLSTIAKYRDDLTKNNQIGINSSILIVVGNQNTDSIEAQVRGSKYAWDIRLISVDGLIKLMKLKETVEDITISNKIWDILTPQDYTKVDKIIDLVFSTAEEADLSSEILEVSEPSKTGQFTESVEDNRDESISRISKYLGLSLIKQSRSTYIAPEHRVSLSCALSREYERNNQSYYWFGFHRAQKQYLEQANTGYGAFVCGSVENIFLFPFDKLNMWLPGLNQTEKGDRLYWHIHIVAMKKNWFLKRRTGYNDIDVTEYLIRK